MADEPISFIVLADDWGRHVSTAQHLFREILPRHPVLWVNSYGHRRPQLSMYDAKRAVSKLWSMISRPAPREQPGSEGPVAIVQPRALPWHNVRLIHSLNSRVISRQLTSAARAYLPAGRRVFVSTTPIAVDVVGSLGEDASIYFCMDDYDVLPGVEKGLIAPFEKRMVRTVDGTVATAQSLLVTRTPPSQCAMHLPQGVNFDHFAAATAEPADLRELPRPLIGFAGGVGPVIDWALMRALAAANPTATVVLVGMQQPGADLRDLPPNVRLLGARPYADLPAYVQAFDVALIPYVLNQHTLAVDPLKLLEYLAAGVPVVSTALPEARKYASHVDVCESPEAFVQAVRVALTNAGDGARARRQAFARQHTWAARAGQFLAFTRQVMEQRRQAAAGSVVR